MDPLIGHPVFSLSLTINSHPGAHQNRQVDHHTFFENNSNTSSKAFLPRHTTILFTVYPTVFLPTTQLMLFPSLIRMQEPKRTRISKLCVVQGLTRSM